MPVSVAQGDPVEFTIAAGTTVGGTGKSFQLNNSTWIALASFHMSITTTATVGTRQFIIQPQDQQGNRIAEAVAATTQTAGTTQRYQFGAGLPSANSASIATAPWPFPLIMPPQSQLVIFDNAAIDANDAITSAAPAVLIYTQ